MDQREIAESANGSGIGKRKYRIDDYIELMWSSRLPFVQLAIQSVL